MFRYIAKRLIVSCIVLILVTVFTFVIVQTAPGGPEILMDVDLNDEDRAEISASLGIDQPLHIQYVKWLGNLVRGDFGTSFSQKVPVSDLLAEKIPNTLYLTVAALILAIIIGVPLGIYSALKPNSLGDYLLSTGSMIGLSIPAFWFSIILVIIFSINLRVLPSAGMYTIGAEKSFGDLLKHMMLPAFVSMLSPQATIMRYTRSSTLEVLNNDYIRTARAKGLSERRILYGHALKNALIPVVTAIGLMIPSLISGSIIVEKIFAWPGMGRLISDSAFNRDYPVVMGATFIVAVMVIVANLITDVIYAFLNPRIRLE